MNRFKKILRSKIVIFLAVLSVFTYLNNSSLLTQQRKDAPLLLAHRGLAQTFTMEGITNETCTAERIYVPDHPYLENTIPSMEAAFQAGADIVEFDIKPTKDGQFAVFHDWTLDCRTNVKGVTKDYTMTELKNLDIGYGYTADHGQTYPFRGHGIGLMPSLDEVLSYFPEQSFLIHIKSNDPNEGEMLAQFLSALPQNRLNQLTIYGGDEPIASLKENLPTIQAMSKSTMKSCLLPYIAAGWAGYVPPACKNTELHIPEKIAPWLWGWPDRFINRMDKSGTPVIVVGGNGSDFSSGFDTADDITRLPKNFTGGIWTNRIDRIAPLYLKR
ncbi:glycerophosphodiester phosphodiesterase family protein [Paenibacillus sp. V4I5]|uniref:glycerophosphodiester phosphodiesterase family protein n=1 Tax=Paenibacillus sp. V4I5 TaxID=3042306 RepID=UPI00279067B5|nr:glycerophosphodiester phosphodiesterase family protein [Paenibacillus sp. V4I5]MDQ0914856.1 glycerophosphoryl diester phosphodiesterase [Paenibacillus sp. V4I5]